MPLPKQFGSWTSTFSAAAVVSGSISLTHPLIFGSRLFWLENRPEEQGRAVVVVSRLDTPNKAMDVTPKVCIHVSYTTLIISGLQRPNSRPRIWR